MSQSQEFTMQPVARIRSEFAEKFGVPRQSGLVAELEAEIVFEPAYRNPDALRGLEEFSHVWLIWVFDRAVRETWSPTVRPPRLGGNARMGVFATRSPFRPNPIALSCVKLAGIRQTADGPVIRVLAVDAAFWALIWWTGRPFWISSPTSRMRTATRTLWAALRLSRRGRRWRSSFRRSCWRGSRKRTGRRCGACWRRTPAPITRKTRSGSTGSPLREWKSVFLWTEPG